MMGQLGSGQDKLFYSFNLDNHVPREHLLRGIDRFLDLRDLRQHLAPFYSPMGRPSIDPELMIRMLIVGYCFGKRDTNIWLVPMWLACVEGRENPPASTLLTPFNRSPSSPVENVSSVHGRTKRRSPRVFVVTSRILLASKRFIYAGGHKHPDTYLFHRVFAMIQLVVGKNRSTNACTSEGR
jgi:hypothetical protein